MSLQEIQQAFSAAVYDQNPEALAQLTAGPGRASPLEGIAVYKNNTRERLRSVLAQTFSVCAQLVGERCFDQMAWVYIDQHPCRTHDLELYGATFNETVEQILDAQPQLRDSVPYLAQMAKVEWLAHRAYFAPDRLSFDFHRFAKLTVEQYLETKFQLAPDVALVTASWPIAALWAMHQPNRTVEPVPVVPIKRGLLIERVGYQSQVTDVDPEMFYTLKVIDEGYSFQSLMERNVEIQSHLTEALQKGWITGFTFDD